NLSRYEIEYSTNNINFIHYGNENAKNQFSNSYTASLVNFTQPLYYLRLRAVDIDGRFSFSNTILVRMSTNSSLSVYPTPATSFVNVSFGDKANGHFQISLADATGKTVIERTERNVVAGQLIKLERGRLAKGIYLLQIVNVETGLKEIHKIIFE
ncbi:MAG: T9SS type A sorting domain-containing protein, partial [Chitinophagaceae bacterium]